MRHDVALLSTVVVHMCAEIPHVFTTVDYVANCSSVLAPMLQTQAELCATVSSKCTPSALFPAAALFQGTASATTRPDVLANIDEHAMSVVVAALRRLASLEGGAADNTSPGAVRTALSQLSQVISKVSTPVIEHSRPMPRVGAEPAQSLNAKRIAQLGEVLRLCVAAKVTNKQFVSDTVLKLHDCFTGVSTELARKVVRADASVVPPPQVLCQLLWSLVKLDFRDDSLFRKIEKVVAGASVMPRPVSSGAAPHAAPGAGATQPVPLLSQFTPLQLSIWVWAFASRDIKPNALDREFGRLLRSCVADAIPKLKVSDICDLCSR